MVVVVSHIMYAYMDKAGDTHTRTPNVTQRFRAPKDTWANGPNGINGLRDD